MSWRNLTFTPYDLDIMVDVFFSYPGYEHTTREYWAEKLKFAFVNNRHIEYFHRGDQQLIWVWKFSPLDIRGRYCQPVMENAVCRGADWKAMLPILKKRLIHCAREIGESKWRTVSFPKRRGGKLETRWAVGNALFRSFNIKFHPDHKKNDWVWAEMDVR